MNSDYLVDFPGLGIHDLPVNREIFSVFGQSIYWYGLLIALAIILCLLLSIRQAKANQLKPDDIMDSFIVMIPMMIIFARLFYVVFEWDYYAQDLRRIFNTRHGGLAFYGGVIGGALAFFLVARFKKIPFHKLLDYLVVYIPLGQAIGRWGNFFNQEAFGSNTSLPWGMYSNETERYLRQLGAGFNPEQPVHPTFLYEFIANIIIFVILILLRKKVKTPYIMTFSYLGMYGFVRFFVEGIRTDSLFIGQTGLRISQLLSALMVIAAILFIIFARRRHEVQLLKAALQDSDMQNFETGETESTSDFRIVDSDGSIGSEQGEPDFIELDEDTSTVIKSEDTVSEDNHQDAYAAAAADDTADRTKG